MDKPLFDRLDRILADDILACGVRAEPHPLCRLHVAGRPEPDLIIRTSGEQRLSNVLLWQSAYSALYFCDAYWPAFREIDFLRALRSYAGRHRRYSR